jgi:hypothetical protein
MGVACSGAMQALKEGRVTGRNDQDHSTSFFLTTAGTPATSVRGGKTCWTSLWNPSWLSNRNLFSKSAGLRRLKSRWESSSLNKEKTALYPSHDSAGAL